MNTKTITLLLAIGLVVFSANAAFSLRYRNNIQIADSGGLVVRGGVASMSTINFVKNYACEDKQCRQLQEEILAISDKLQSNDQKVIEKIQAQEDKEVQQLYKKVTKLEETLQNPDKNANLAKINKSIDELTAELLKKASKLDKKITKLSHANATYEQQLETKCDTFNDKYPPGKKDNNDLYEN